MNTPVEPTTPPDEVRFRRHDWFDTKSNQSKFGISAKLVGWHVSWRHCAEGNKPLIFDTAEERDAKLKELRKRK